MLKKPLGLCRDVGSIVRAESGWLSFCLCGWAPKTDVLKILQLLSAVGVNGIDKCVYWADMRLEKRGVITLQSDVEAPCGENKKISYPWAIRVDPLCPGSGNVVGLCVGCTGRAWSSQPPRCLPSCGDLAPIAGWPCLHGCQADVSRSRWQGCHLRSLKEAMIFRVLWPHVRSLQHCLCGRSRW